MTDGIFVLFVVIVVTVVLISASLIVLIAPTFSGSAFLCCFYLPQTLVATIRTIRGIAIAIWVSVSFPISALIIGVRRWNPCLGAGIVVLLLGKAQLRSDFSRFLFPRVSFGIDSFQPRLEHLDLPLEHAGSHLLGFNLFDH